MERVATAALGYALLRLHSGRMHSGRIGADKAGEIRPRELSPGVFPLRGSGVQDVPHPSAPARFVSYALQSNPVPSYAVQKFGLFKVPSSVH